VAHPFGRRRFDQFHGKERDSESALDMFDARYYASRRMAQAFDLTGIPNTAGAPSFAHFAKGGSWKCVRKWLDHAARSRNEIFVQPPASVPES
jgi:hypothetical protein